MDRWFFTCIFCQVVDENGKSITGNEDDIFATDVVDGRYENASVLVQSGVLDPFTSHFELSVGENLKFEVYTYEYLGSQINKVTTLEALKGDEFVQMRQTGQLVPLDDYEVFATIEA